MRLRPTTVRARLTLWYTLVLSLPLVAFAIISWVIFSRTLHGRTDAFIQDALAVFSRELGAERRAHPAFDDALRTTLREVRFRDLDIVLLDTTRAILASSARVAPMLPAANTLASDSAVIMALARELRALPGPTTVRGASGSYRVSARALEADGRRLILAGAYPLLEVESALQRIGRIFLIAIPLLVIVAATGGYFLAKRSFQPVSAMAARAAEISATTLHERLPIAAQDELGSLARVLNDLLDRLERAFAQQRRFMADASHELRTPTAILRTEADVTLSRPSRPEHEYRESMAIVQDAARRISRIVDDIFLLARADAGHLNPAATNIYLDDVVQDTIRTLRPLADQHNVRITLGNLVEAPFAGDADLLGRVLLNLIDNAIKHAPPDSDIQVDMQKNGNGWCISVVDHGPGIPPEFHDRIFERFFRVDAARSRARSTTSGAGLGLSIGRRIAELHGGRLELASSTPGRTEFRLFLPATGSPVATPVPRG